MLVIKPMNVMLVTLCFSSFKVSCSLLDLSVKEICMRCCQRRLRFYLRWPGVFHCHLPRNDPFAYFRRGHPFSQFCKFIIAKSTAKSIEFLWQIIEEAQQKSSSYMNGFHCPILYSHSRQCMRWKILIDKHGFLSMIIYSLNMILMSCKKAALCSCVHSGYSHVLCVFAHVYYVIKTKTPACDIPRRH